MKALRTLIATVALLGGAMTMNAQRMSIAAMQSNARFLTDRMAYTLGIRDPYLIDEIYRINYDYIWGVNDYLDDVALGYYYDDYIAVCEARDLALRSLLGIRLWNRVLGYNYFYRPIVFANRGWHFSIYDYDRFGPRHFYFGAPRPIARGYAGGHFFGGMAPRGGRPGMAPAPRGGAPAPHVAPRGDAPTPHVTPRGGNMGGNRGSNMGGNMGGAQPQQNGGRGAGIGTRSGNNLRSSSRTNATPTTRTNATAPTRTNATPITRTNASAPTRSAGAANRGTARGNAGGRTGGRR